MCECVLPVHLRALSSGHNNNCSIICVHVRQNESVFNQEDRKTEATENYWICFHRRDNYQIKQIPLIKQLTLRSNQQPGQRQQHLEMWRWSTFRVAAQIRGRIVSSFWSLAFGMKRGMQPSLQILLFTFIWKVDWAPHTFKVLSHFYTVDSLFSAVFSSHFIIFSCWTQKMDSFYSSFPSCICLARAGNWISNPYGHFSDLWAVRV